MAIWTRSGNKLTKTRQMHDGELLSLLAARTPLDDEEFDERVYQGLLAQQDDQRKANAFALAAGALGVLAYFRLLTNVRAIGVEVAPNGFSHIALILLGLASLFSPITYARLNFFKSWFEWKYARGDRSQKVSLLLRYPQAFNAFYFIRGVHGYPKHMKPERKPLRSLFFLYLTVTALIILVVAYLGLWFGLAIEVWRSAFPSHAIAAATIGTSALLWIIGALVPSYQRSNATYEHEGMVTLWSKIRRRNPERAEYFARKMAEAIKSMSQTGD
jgi:hypothetical protein